MNIFKRHVIDKVIETTISEYLSGSKANTLIPLSVLPPESHCDWHYTPPPHLEKQSTAATDVLPQKKWL